MDSILYFRGNGASGSKLWRSDGTNAGTYVLKDSPGSPENITRVGSRVFFSAYDQVNTNLWATDGTDAGTQLLMKMRFIEGVGVGEKLYFTPVTGYADDGEIWESDGTAAGTRLAVDTTGDTGASKPAKLTRVGTKIYYTALTEEYGRELFVYDTAAPLQAPPTVVDRNASSIGRFAVNVTGAVNPRGGATNISVEYGTSASYGSVVNGPLVSVDGAGQRPVTVPLGSLLAGTLYHYRIVATNADGTTTTTSGTFTTLPNAAPSVPALSFAAWHGTGVSVPVSTVLAGALDAEGDAVSLFSAPANSAQGGTVVLQGNVVVYTPAAGFSGTDTFQLTARDAYAATSQVPVTVSVATASAEKEAFKVNDAPGDGKKLRMMVEPGRGYEIQRSFHLNGDWETVLTVPANSSGVIEFLDPQAPDARAFYRRVYLAD